MIEIIVDQTGDRAEAEDHESAIVAAITLCDDLMRQPFAHGFRPTVTFLDADGEPIRRHISQQVLWTAGAGVRS